MPASSRWMTIAWPPGSWPAGAHRRPRTPTGEGSPPLSEWPGCRGVPIGARDDRAVLLLHPGAETLLQRGTPARSLLARRRDERLPIVEAVAHVLLRDLGEHVLEAPLRVARDVGVAGVEEDER